MLGRRRAAASRLLLGQDHQHYGSFSVVPVGLRAAAAISIGADPESPSNRFKGDPEAKNEDALSIIDDGTIVTLAVADAHFGVEASHWLISTLHTRLLARRPTEPDMLRRDLADSATTFARTDSESTLLVVSFDRRTGSGFGFSFGDSTAALVGLGGVERLNERDHFYVAADSRDLDDGSGFRFSARTGDLLMVYTDGIDECHYRSPATSIRHPHIAHVAQEAGFEPLVTVSALVRLALKGVNGYPGGQDNIGIAAVTC